MLRTYFTRLVVLVGVAGLAIGGCNGAVDTTKTTAGTRGAFTGSGWACACPNGGMDCALPCPDGTDGSCSNGQPYCNVTKVDAGLACACPNGQGTCSVRCPDGASGTCESGKPTCGGSSKLQWYETCGTPVCEAPTGDAGSSCVPDSAQCAAVGTSCSTKGQTCNDCTQACGAKIVCDDHDPKGGVGGCPISSRKFKENIGYLGASDLQQLHEEAMRLKLATYQYKNMYGNPYETHLGFIIEDNPQSLAVDRGHDRIDMYGYLSMLTASMQVQEQEIRELRRELAACKR
jgi:hypothetical protein